MSFSSMSEYGFSFLGGSIYLDDIFNIPLPSSLSTLRPFFAGPCLQGAQSAVLGKVTFIIT